MERQIESAPRNSPGLGGLRQQVQDARKRWTNAPELDGLEAHYHRVERVIVGASRRAMTLQLALLDYRIRTIVQDLLNAENFQNLLDEARSAADLAIHRNQTDLARRFGHLLADAESRRVADHPAFRRGCAASLRQLLEEADALDRLDDGLGEMRARLAALETRQVSVRSPGELTILRRLLDRVDSAGSLWSATVRERLMLRIASGLRRLEELERDSDALTP